MLKILKKYTLEILVFIGGAVIMIFELTGSRVLAPYLGTSIFVWTSLIGIIMASLSLGYWWGGKIADKKATYETFSLIFFSVALLICLSALSKNPILNFLQNNISDIRLNAVLSSFILFAPASIFLGMISPYAVKLKIRHLDCAGQTVGNLYALSTAGSILGTFLGGFFLISLFGNTKLLILLALLMSLASLIAHSRKLLTLKIVAILSIAVYLGLTGFAEKNIAKNGITELDTAYSHVKIFNDIDHQTIQPVKRLVNNTNSSSAMFLNSDELVYSYTKFYRLARHFIPDIKSGLMIGGGAYSYPKDFLAKFPEATLDVVEIDPQLTNLAKKHFRLAENPNLQIFHEDGRTFLNKNTKTYDVIFGDAFANYFSIPYQLTTQESVEKFYNSLTDNGAAMINIISSIEGDTGEFLRAEYKTFKTIFPQVYIFPVQYPLSGSKLQNIILVALKSGKKPSFEEENLELNLYLKHLWTKEIAMDMPVLTDEYAPVDQYIMKFLKVL